MVQEVTTQSWGSRIGGAFVGVLIGIALIIGAFVLIFWNEAEGLHTAQSLQQTEKIVITVPNSPIDPKNNLKVIHFSGQATTNEILQDPLLATSVNAIRLIRQVEMFQWQQNEEKRTEKQMGGSEQTVTTYTYEPIWSEYLIDSSHFKDQTNHQNPTSMPFKSVTHEANKVVVGDFILPQALVLKITQKSAVDLTNTDLTKLQESTQLKIQHNGNGLYLGENIQKPQVGDLKIALFQVLPQPVSVIAEQTGNTLQAYQAPAGKPVALLVGGLESPQQMIHEAQEENRIFTWVLRLASLVMMMLGVGLILRPLSVLADVIPIFGSIVGFGSGIIAFICGLFLWAVATAIAWFIVRPLYAILLMVGVFALCYVLIRSRRKKIISQ